jgi:hypothetical protein
VLITKDAAALSRKCSPESGHQQYYSNPAQAGFFLAIKKNPGLPFGKPGF